MQTYQNKSLEEKIQKLRSENRSLRDLIAALKSEIHDLKRLNKWINDLLTSNPTGIILIQKGKILYINKIVLEELGYKHDEVIGQTFLGFVHPENNEIENTIHNNLITGKKSPEHNEIRLVNNEGETLCYDMRFNSIRLKGKKALILNLTRAEKRKEEERKTRIREKRDALTKMALGLSSELDRCIEAAMHNSKDFRSIAFSDDINLNGILEDLQNALHNARLVSNDLELLSMGRMDQNDLYPISISEIAKDAVMLTKSKWNNKSSDNGLMIDLKTYLRSKSKVECDPEKIKQVIVNMIHNSVEAMPRGGEIHLTTEDSAGHVHIYIQDTGEGIPDQLRDKIYDPFFTTRGEDHKGLGLSLCHSIIKNHRGNIEMTSSMNQGAMFEIKIPLARKKPKRRSKSAKKKIKNVQILIIQDEDFIRELMAQFFNKKGCRVDTAVSGLEGLGKMKKKKCDLVIADTEIEDVNRDSFVKKGRLIDPKLPIVLIDGHKDDQAVIDYKEPVADLIFTKPIDINITVNKVLELLIDRD